MYKYLYKYPHSAEILVTDSINNIDTDKVKWIKKIKTKDLDSLKLRYQYKLDKDRARRIYKNEIHRVPFSAEYRKNRRTDYKNELRSLKLNRGFSESDNEIDNCYNFGLSGVGGTGGNPPSNLSSSKVPQTKPKGNANLMQILLNQANSNAINTVTKPLSTPKNGSATKNQTPNTSQLDQNTVIQNMRINNSKFELFKQSLNYNNSNKETPNSRKVDKSNTNSSTDHNAHNQNKGDQNQGKNENKDKAEHSGEFIKKIEEAKTDKSEAESKIIK